MLHFHLLPVYSILESLSYTNTDNHPQKAVQEKIDFKLRSKTEFER